MPTPPTAVDYKPGSAYPAAATRRHPCLGPLRCIPGIKGMDHSGATLYPSVCTLHCVVEGRFTLAIIRTLRTKAAFFCNASLINAW